MKTFLYCLLCVISLKAVAVRAEPNLPTPPDREGACQIALELPEQQSTILRQTQKLLGSLKFIGVPQGDFTPVTRGELSALEVKFQQWRDLLNLVLQKCWMGAAAQAEGRYPFLSVLQAYFKALFDFALVQELSQHN